MVSLTYVEYRLIDVTLCLLQLTTVGRCVGKGQSSQTQCMVPSIKDILGP